ncbi:MAG: radical SAM protein, partial [Candidatus Aminicenantes bacterium]|nr:radical SAM protein [Candidatus Aminicenantes bacterium]
MDKHLFGPVPSRRLGISLGIDIIPFKTCTLDCLYCECGRTTDHTAERRSFFSTKDLMSEFNEFLKTGDYLDYITFSGSGEPTLNSDIGHLIKEIKEMTRTPVAVITNGTLLHLPEVQKDLLSSDLILPSLDAVSEDVFRKINKPAPGITAEKVINGLKSFSREYKGEIWLEVFISRGINDSEGELEKIREVIEQIMPSKVQLNSLDRPPAYSEAEPAGHDLLGLIVEKWNGLPVEIIKRVKRREEIPSFSKNLESNILNTIVRRPLTIEDLIILTGKNRLEILKYIDVLEKEKQIRTEIV